MRLLRAQFEERWERGALTLALVGMSNIGKSWLAGRLSSELGAAHVEVDTFIRDRLDHPTMADFAHWLGHPNTEGYAAREAQSLALEDEATGAALDAVGGERVVLDTTGSVIYCARAVERLRSEAFTVYLRASAEQRTTLETLYFSHPKPLNWAGAFNQRDGEMFGDAVSRCYPALLDRRDKLYAAVADRVVSADALYAAADGSAMFELLKPDH